MKLALFVWPISIIAAIYTPSPMHTNNNFRNGSTPMNNANNIRLTMAIIFNALGTFSMLPHTHTGLVVLDHKTKFDRVEYESAFAVCRSWQFFLAWIANCSVLWTKSQPYMACICCCIAALQSQLVWFTTVSIIQSQYCDLFALIADLLASFLLLFFCCVATFDSVIII